MDAFDFSEIAKDKVLKEAAKKDYKINYWLQDLSTFKAGKKYDAIALIYVHLPELLPHGNI